VDWWDTNKKPRTGFPARGFWQLDCLPAALYSRRWVTPREMRDQAHDEHHQEYEEQNLRDSCCGKRDNSEPQDRCNDRDHQEYKRVVQHFVLPSTCHSQGGVTGNSAITTVYDKGTGIPPVLAKTGNPLILGT
jgi:hypothetical protein